MKTKPTSKTFAFYLLLLCASLFTTCQNEIKPQLAGARTVIDQRFMHMNVTQIQKLSEMSEDECIEFIIENGVIIPDRIINRPGLGADVKSIIQQAERYPNMPMGFSYSVTQHFAKSIQEVVKRYYGAALRNLEEDTPYILVDSLVENSSGNG